MLPLAGKAHDLAIKRLTAGEDDPKPCFAGEEPCARCAPIFVIEGRLTLSGRALEGALAHRHGLARQRKLIGLQINAGNEHAIGRKKLALIYNDKIARNEPRRRDFPSHPISQHTRLRGQASGQSLGRGLCAPVQIGIHARDRHQGQGKNTRFDIVPEPGEEECGCDKQPDHGVPRRVSRNVAPARASIPEDVVAAVEDARSSPE